MDDSSDDEESECEYCAKGEDINSDSDLGSNREDEREMTPKTASLPMHYAFVRYTEQILCRAYLW